ncbi:MFS general substrate transporter [Butyriboletus roseoflavus]|nr:MFS general substrate transporter [Butyriboletus roseoflavus]
MADIEKQPSLPARKSSFEGTTCEISPRNSTLQPETPLIPAAGNASNRLRAWLAVSGGFLALFCSFGQLTAFGTFQTWFSAAVDVFLHGASTLLPKQRVAQGILFGLGVAMIFYPTVACVATHFNDYRATAIGIVSAGSGCGGVVYPLMFRYLFNAVGFGWAVRISSLMTAVLCGVAIFTVRLQHPIKKNASLVLDVRITKDLRFLYLVLGSFFVCLGMFTPYFYIADYTESLHVPSNAAFYVLSAMNAGGVFGRVAPAWLSDKIGRFNILFPSAFLSGLSCLVFWMFSKDLVAITLFATIFGFLSGAFISVITPCVAQISDIREIGARIGALYTFISVPSLFGGPIAGALIQRQHGMYTASIALAGSSMILGSVLLLVTKLMIDRRFFCCV